MAKPKMIKTKISKEWDIGKFKSEALKFNKTIGEISTGMFNKGHECSRNIIKTIKVSKDSHYVITVNLKRDSKRFEMIYNCIDPDNSTIIIYNGSYSKEKDIITDITRISDLIDGIKNKK